MMKVCKKEEGKKKRCRTYINVPIKYPIDDLLVTPPTADDPALLKRPSLATEFRVPRYSVGDLHMLWDLCMSFGRVLNVSPFSLADLDNAICDRERNVLVEIHTILTCSCISRMKVSSVTWAEYLCYFLEMTKIEEHSELKH
ncbi:hypothetical protein ACP70R_045608 [Stipagrostis hirtigluma subsp. patula]